MALNTGRFFAKLARSPANGLRVTAAFFVLLSTAKDLSAQLSGQSFVVTSDTTAATVGDSVTLRFRIRLHERDQPLDSIPQIVGTLPPGVRVLSVTTLNRLQDRVYEGSARIAFYRPGRRPVPIFGLTFMRVVSGVSHATLPSDSAFVEIRAVLPPAGNPALRDIRELEPRPSSFWPWAALAAALLAGVALYRHLRRKPALPAAVEPDQPAEPPTPSPYEVAMERLNLVEAENWARRGNVTLHYEAVAQTIRQYLEDAHAVGALERTTAELLWAIPPHLSKAGLRDQCYEILSEADLVKFAEVRPGEPAAMNYLRRARRLLESWHAAQPEESARALR